VIILQIIEEKDLNLLKFRPALQTLLSTAKCKYFFRSNGSSTVSEKPISLIYSVEDMYDEWSRFI
jgi:hypothetical protein